MHSSPKVMLLRLAKICHGPSSASPSMEQARSPRFRERVPKLSPCVSFQPPSMAPSGLAFYKGDLFPQWKDSVFAGTLRGNSLERLTLKDNKVTVAPDLLAIVEPPTYDTLEALITRLDAELHGQLSGTPTTTSP